jgi:hypothetical protein
MMAPFTEIPEGMSPATLEMLDRAFSATWHELQLRDGATAPSEADRSARAAIAKSILELGATGVRDQRRLKRHGLHAADQAAQRTAVDVAE